MPHNPARNPPALAVGRFNKLTDTELALKSALAKILDYLCKCKVYCGCPVCEARKLLKELDKNP
jgi:hypothetical protein